MRPLEARSFTDSIYISPDTIAGTALAQTALAFDYPSGARIGRVSLCSSIAGFSAVLNPASTGAILPGSSLATTLSSGWNICFNHDKLFLIPGGTTGYSLVSPSSGYVSVEFWKY